MVVSLNVASMTHHHAPRRRLLFLFLGVACFSLILYSLVNHGSGGVSSSLLVEHEQKLRSDHDVGRVHKDADLQPWPEELAGAVQAPITSSEDPVGERDEENIQNEQQMDDLVTSDDRVGDTNLQAFKYRQHGKFTILMNYVMPELQANDGHIVTYTTHGEVTFIGHLPVLAARWAAPISMGLYVPGTDFNLAVKCIAYARWCHPPVKRWVTFHMVFGEGHFPPVRVHGVREMSEKLREMEAGIDCAKKPWENVTTYRDALWRKEVEKKIPKAAVPNEELGTGEPTESIPVVVKPGTKEWKEIEAKVTPPLFYPINVIRNVAREAATTLYVLASDVELYPSANFAKEFAEMVKKLGDIGPKVVFPMPIFEVKANCSVPETKRQLLEMFKNKDAIPFHAQVCPACHRFPMRDAWLKATNSAEMSVLGYATRTGPFRSWEPIYVGTNAEPPYDERLSWEGKKDKMTQMYALCAMGYKFAILDNAFLVHSPGIKVYHRIPWRDAVAAKQASFVQKVVKPELTALYGVSPNCYIT